MDDGAGLQAELPKLDEHFYFILLFCHFVVYVSSFTVIIIYVVMYINTYH